eukprot:11553_4
MRSNQELFNEGRKLLRLVLDELVFAPLADLEKGLACHVLDTRMRLVHELEQLIHHSFEELPVRTQESRILSDYVHDVASDHCLIVFPSHNFTKPQKILDHVHKEFL